MSRMDGWVDYITKGSIKLKHKRKKTKKMNQEMLKGLVNLEYVQMPKS